MDARRVAEDCGIRRQGMSTRRQLSAAGLTPPRLAEAVATGTVVRLRRRVYATAHLPALPRFVVTDRGVSAEYVAHVRAVLLSLGQDATACGRTAAALYGWEMLVEPSRLIDVAVPHGRKPVVGQPARVSQRRRLARVRHVVLAGTDPLWLTAPVQTVLDCASRLPLVEATVLCDSALRSGAVQVAELVRAAAQLRGVREAARARRVLELCDPAAGSVLESVLRVRLLLEGICGFGTQAVLRQRPELRVDFCFAAARLVVEVDGHKWHQDPGRDQLRDNALAALGWRVLRYGWVQVVHEPGAVLAEIAEAVRTNRLHLGSADLLEAA